VAAPDSHRAIEAVFRIEFPRLVAGLTHLVRDVGLAEDLAQDALVAALERWPETGLPESPGAWLMATAKHRAVDRLRHAGMAERKHAELGRGADEASAGALAELESALDDPIGDDLLRLVFVACHPLLAAEARVALTLRLIGGLTTEEIARAFLVPTSTVAQRIVRAKRALADARVPFEVPRGEELAARLDSVLEVIYLIFNEGYSATAGDEWTRPALCHEAVRLARIVGGLLPREPEVLGLVALVELQASRLAARRGPGGEPVLLLDQDRARWDRLLVRRGLAALGRAEALAGGARGPYLLQAAIAACHARAATAEATGWGRIASLYGELARVQPSPVVELNRAVAVGMAEGPSAGLAIVDRLRDEPKLAGYHLLPAVRGDLLAKLGRSAEAAAELARAEALTRNVRERRLLRDRIAALGGDTREGFDVQKTVEEPAREA
jgi:RNA polymerase sigma factor (sigma-70 family)